MSDQKSDPRDQQGRSDQSVGAPHFGVFAIASGARRKIADWFTYHPPRGDQAVRYEFVRDSARDLAYRLCLTCPQSPELDKALECLRSAVFWANASIACNPQLMSCGPVPKEVPDEQPAAGSGDKEGSGFPR